MANHPNRGARSAAANPRPEAIRAAREAAALTQTEAAALVHATCRRWQEWEAGDYRMHPGLFELFKLKAQACAPATAFDLQPVPGAEDTYHVAACFAGAAQGECRVAVIADGDLVVLRLGPLEACFGPDEALELGSQLDAAAASGNRAALGWPFEALRAGACRVGCGRLRPKGGEAWCFHVSGQFDGDFMGLYSVAVLADAERVLLWVGPFEVRLEHAQAAELGRHLVAAAEASVQARRELDAESEGEGA